MADSNMKVKAMLELLCARVEEISKIQEQIVISQTVARQECTAQTALLNSIAHEIRQTQDMILLQGFHNLCHCLAVMQFQYDLAGKCDIL